MQTVGERLRRAREQAGMTQEQLAREIGATRSAIAQVESGTSTSLNAENLAKAARCLGKSAVWLATGEGEEVAFDAIGQALSALTQDDQKQVFDFILYKIERGAVPYAQQNGASYAAMIQRLKADMEARRTPETNPPRKP